MRVIGGDPFFGLLMLRYHVDPFVSIGYNWHMKDIRISLTDDEDRLVGHAAVDAGVSKREYVKRATLATLEGPGVPVFIEWLYDQGYEIISRGRLLAQKDPALSKRIHAYCLDDSEAQDVVAEWMEEQGAPIPFPPDDNITPSA
jgi:hypothetical protein